MIFALIDSINIKVVEDLCLEQDDTTLLPQMPCPYGRYCTTYQRSSASTYNLQHIIIITKSYVLCHTFHPTINLSGRELATMVLERWSWNSSSIWSEGTFFLWEVTVGLPRSKILEWKTWHHLKLFSFQEEWHQVIMQSSSSSGKPVGKRTRECIGKWDIIIDEN